LPFRSSRVRVPSSALGTAPETGRVSSPCKRASRSRSARRPEGTIEGDLDLEALWPDPDGGNPVPAIVDDKLNRTLHSQAKADNDPQAGLYLAGRWLAGDPAQEFSFAQIGKPGARRKQMSTSFVTASRSVGQLLVMLARIAPAASQIAACTSASGPISRGPSPTRPAGSAARAAARTAPAAWRQRAIGKRLSAPPRPTTPGGVME
jgi:hypothetical protein